MLVLIGTVPTAYALNRAVLALYETEFHANALAATEALSKHARGITPKADPRAAVTAYIADEKLGPDTVASLGALVVDIDREVMEYGTARQGTGRGHRQHAQ